MTEQTKSIIFAVIAGILIIWLFGPDLGAESGGRGREVVKFEKILQK